MLFVKGIIIGMINTKSAVDVYGKQLNIGDEVIVEMRREIKTKGKLGNFIIHVGDIKKIILDVDNLNNNKIIVENINRYTHVDGQWKLYAPVPGTVTCYARTVFKAQSKYDEPLKILRRGNGLIK